MLEHRFQNLPDQQAAAVALDFGHILAGIAVGGTHQRQQRLVKGLACQWIGHPPQIQVVGVEVCPGLVGLKYRPDNRFSPLAADTDNGHASRTGRRGNCRYRIVFVHSLYSAGARCRPRSRRAASSGTMLSRRR